MIKHKIYYALETTTPKGSVQYVGDHGLVEWIRQATLKEKPEDLVSLLAKYVARIVRVLVVKPLVQPQSQFHTYCIDEDGVRVNPLSLLEQGHQTLLGKVVNLLSSGDDEGCDGLVVVDREAFMELREEVHLMTGESYGSIREDDDEELVEEHKPDDEDPEGYDM